MKKVAVILAEGFEEVEAIVPVDILRRADIIVCLLGLEEIVESARGVQVRADALLTDRMMEEYDSICLPGGVLGAKNLAQSPLVREFIQKAIDKRRLVSAICASPAIVLASGGFLGSVKYTGYPDRSFPYEAGGTYLESHNLVLDQGFLTAKSMAYVLDFSLALVSLLESPVKGCKIAKDIYYEDWDLKYKNLYHSLLFSDQNLDSL